MPRLFNGPTGDADTAFVHKVQHQLHPTLSTSASSASGDAALRASPIYNAVLRFASPEREMQQRQQCDAVTANRHVASPSTTPAHVLPPALARRGVGLKDPLLQRKLRKQQQEKQQTTSTASLAGLKSDENGNLPVGVEHQQALHWSKRPLHLMTSAGWDVFREQVGIQMEVVARRAPGQQPPQRKHPVTEKYTTEALRPIRCWEEAQLPLALGTVVSRRYLLPSPIQSQCVPLLMASAATSSGKIDVLGVAETGSGKTAAYLIPLLADVLKRTPKLLGNDKLIAHGPLALVVVPTRELAEQVAHEALGFVHGLPAAELQQLVKQEFEEDNNMSGIAGDGNEKVCIAAQQCNTLDEIRVVKIVGGERAELQYDALAGGVHVVIGTLGQLDALLQQRLLALGNTRFVVLDEADRMIEEQQRATLVAVLERCPLPRQTIMLTATLSAACEEVALKYFSPDGFVVVRVPHRCSTITQVFELMPSNPHFTRGGVEKTAETRVTEEEYQLKQPQTAERRHNPLLHPIKFARLVTYLAYASPPVVVFANEKRTCDMLKEELLAEAAHLATLAESFPLEALIGEIPLVLQRGAHAPQRSRSSLSLNNMLSLVVVHSEQSQAERRRLVDLFRRGARCVVITTDLLARGLDIPNISLVINYDLPRVSPVITHLAGTNAEDAVQKYIHRIGRTGRAGASGVAVSFLCLPSVLIKRAQQHVLRAAPGGLERQQVQMQRIEEALGASAKAVTHKLDRRELTDRKNGYDSDESLLLQPDEEEEEEEGMMNDEDGDGGQPRARRRVEQQERLSDAPPSSFQDDELLLQPLWSFLVGCAEGNKDGADTTRGADLIRRQQCRHLHLPSALVALMVAFTQRSPYGTITA